MNGKPKEQALWFCWTMDPSVQNRNRIIEWYLPFVQHLANQTAERIPNNLIDSDDLYSIGVIALMGCIDRFEPSRGLKFTTAAGTRIRGAFKDELRRIDWQSRNARPKCRAVERAIADLDDDGPVDFDRVSQMTGFSAAECEKLIESQTDWLQRGCNQSVLELCQ